MLDDAVPATCGATPPPGSGPRLSTSATALDTERPTLEPMGREEHVDLHGYNDEEPAAVGGQLVATAMRLADDLAGLDGAGQQRAGVQSWPEDAERTLEWVARYTVHEMKHHLREIESLLAAARRRTAGDPRPCPTSPGPAMPTALLSPRTTLTPASTREGTRAGLHARLRRLRP